MGVRGIQGEGSVELLQGLGLALHHEHCPADVVAGECRERGILLHGLLVGFDGTSVVSLTKEDAAEIGVGFGIMGAHLDGLTQEPGTFFVTALKREGDAVIRMSDPSFRVAADGFEPEFLLADILCRLLPTESSEQGDDRKADDELHAGGNHRTERRDESDGRDVHPVVPNGGEKRAVNIQDATDREDGTEVEQLGDKGAPADPPAQKPRCEENGRNTERKEPVPELSGLRAPVRVDETKPRGPEQLPEIEPTGATCTENTLSDGGLKFAALRAYMAGFQPPNEATESEGNQEKGKDGQDITPPLKATMFPPGDKEKGGRKNKSGDFSEECTEEKEEGEHPRSEAETLVRLPVVNSMAIGKKGGKSESERKGVFALGDPGHGFDHDRMESEDGSGKPSSGETQTGQDESEQTCAEAVEKDVFDVVGERPPLPELPVEPESAGGQRIVLLEQWIIGPAANESAGSGKKRQQLGRPGIVIPDEPTV